jgi:serine/threonine protein kinase
MEDLVGRDIGRYRLVQRIGKGGMSSVYRAVDMERGDDVAIKLLSPHIGEDPKFRARFAREARVLAELSHPNIVPILDYGEAKGYAYLTMPFKIVGTLQAQLDNGGFLPRQVARIVGDIASALDYAHQRGVIHRDVKPSNILLAEDGNALLSDFGLAYVQDVSVSLTGSVLIGTPAYMSPEQCRGEKVGLSSDQYSLGVIMFEMFTGQLPYQAETPMGVVAKHMYDPLPRPRYINPVIPESIEQIIFKTMAKKPGDRFASVTEMNDSLQDALLEALDPETGEFKPSAVSSEAITEFLITEEHKDKKPFYRKFTFQLGAILLLLIPISTWAFGDSILGVRGDVLSGENTASAALLGTIEALGTENAILIGDQASPGEIQTALAGTVQAMGLLDEPSLSPTPTPSVENIAEVTVTLTRTPSPTSTRNYGSSTPTSDGGDPPENTATFTPTSTKTPDGTATFTLPPPTDTPIPPTNTPKPVNPHACNDTPGNPNYCTPTPTP